MSTMSALPQLKYEDSVESLLARYHGLGLRRRPELYELVYHYPPARTFTRAFAASIRNAFADTLLQDLLLYVHIPFSNSRCTFCHYVCHATQDVARMSEYVRALEREMLLHSRVPAIRNARVRAVHIGGGTPTALPVPLLTQTLGHLADLFDLSHVREVSIEASPETLLENPDLAHTLVAIGVTRLSVGVQSFDDDVLRHAHRAHDARVAEAAVHHAAHAGFRDLNLDLIYGLAQQDLPSWRATLKRAVALPVSSICVYQCRVAPRKHQAQQRRVGPGELGLLQMGVLAEGYLRRHGFVPVQPNQWVRTGGHFHGYVEGKWAESVPTLGLGQSAYSSFPFATYVNARRSEAYLATDSHIECGLPPVTHVGWLDRRRLLAQRLVLGWRAFGTHVNLNSLAHEFAELGAEIDKYGRLLRRLAVAGLFAELSDTFVAASSALHRADEISTLLYSQHDQELLARIGPSPYGAYLPWPPSKDEVVLLSQEHEVHDQ